MNICIHVLLYEVFRYHNAVLMLMMTTGTMVYRDKDV